MQGRTALWEGGGGIAVDNVVLTLKLNCAILTTTVTAIKFHRFKYVSMLLISASNPSMNITKIRGKI